MFHFKSLFVVVVACAAFCTATSLSVAQALPQPTPPKTEQERLDQILNSLVTVEFKDKALRDCLEELGTLSKANVAFDEDDLKRRSVDMSLPMRLKLTHCRFRTALKALLADTSCAWRPDQGMVQILSSTTAAQIVRRSHSLAKLKQTGLSAGQIASAVVATLEPDSWDFMGGPGRLQIENQALNVEQSPAIHDAIHALLADLQVVRSVKQPGPPQLSKLRAALNASVTQVCTGKPLSTVLPLLLPDHNIVFNERQILAAGFDIHQPVAEDLKGLPLHVALSKILEEASLVWYVDDELIWVTTARDSLARLQTRVFPRPKLPEDQSMAMFLEKLQADVEPASWNAVGGCGSILDKLPGTLIVRHTPPTLRKIEEYLSRK